MADTIEKINDSVIQHGEDNNRVYLMKLANAHVTDTIEQILTLAAGNEYTKIIAKAPERAKPCFEQYGFRVEAVVPGFFGGCEDCFFMAKYLSDGREVESDPEAVRHVLDTALEKASDDLPDHLNDGLSWRIAGGSDAEEISLVYREVFKSYPFPIHKKDYILETMRENVIYFTVRENDRVISVASCEMDTDAKNVEMTDFATLPDHRGSGLAVFLLAQMETAMRDTGMLTAYTIARSLSYGMNITFAKLGYKFAGTLTNNTDICGNLESMNIWYKPLVREPTECLV